MTVHNFCRYCQHTARDRGELNHDLEQLAFFIVPVEQAADDDQVSGARHRQKLGKPFHDPKNQSFDYDDEVHESACLRR